jgi:signal transduction histidine kinase
MRSNIFLKIFFSFWLTQALFLGITLVRADRPDERFIARWRSMTADALSLWDNTAIEFLYSQQQKQATDYLHQLEKTTDTQLYWVDQFGHELYGNKVTARQKELAKQVLAKGEPQFIMEPKVNFVGQVESGLDGVRYALVLRAEHLHGPFPFRRSSGDFIRRLLLPILISGFVCFLLARYLTGPIVKLRTATQQLATGNLSARATTTRRRDEISALVVDFNRMAGRIESLVSSQRQLIADISHELRSPLARLSVALALARQRANQESTKALDRIELEADRLNDMIGNLLLLARMESGTPASEKIVVNIADLLKEVAADADFEARSRNCAVHLGTADECTANGSPGLLRSAFENVVRNAVRYTAEGTTVQIDLHCVSDKGSASAVVTVRDHGPGVPEEEIGNLFRPFYRLDASRERETGGTGLGLAITDRAVRLHGGSATAQNAPGGGLLVRISLPASEVPVSAV